MTSWNFRSGNVSDLIGEGAGLSEFGPDPSHRGRWPWIETLQTTTAAMNIHYVRSTPQSDWLWCFARRRQITPSKNAFSVFSSIKSFPLIVLEWRWRFAFMPSAGDFIMRCRNPPPLSITAVGWVQFWLQALGSLFQILFGLAPKTNWGDAS